MRILAIALLVAAACGDTSEIEREASEAAREVADVGEAMGRWLEMSREEFEREFADRREELAATVADLQERADAAATEGGAELGQAMDDLEAGWSRLKERGDELSDVAGTSWKESRQHVVEAMRDVGEAVERARSQLAGDGG